MSYKNWKNVYCFRKNYDSGDWRKSCPNDKLSRMHNQDYLINDEKYEPSKIPQFPPVDCSKLKQKKKKTRESTEIRTCELSEYQNVDKFLKNPYILAERVFAVGPNK